METLDNKKNNSTVKLILGSIIFIIALLAILVGSITYVVNYKIHEIDTDVSPNEKYELILQQVGDPDWPFGSTHARVVLKEGDKIIKKYRFDVHNDGGNISDNSWIVTWYDNSVVWIAYGEEQPDQSYRICFDGTGTVFSKSLDTHYGVKYESGKTVKEEEIETNPVDEEGYPIDDEWQSYKRELSKIASTIDSVSDSEIECCISAKGYPYAILRQEINENTGEKVEYHLIFNESYSDSSKHEYVLEKYSFSTGSEEAPLISIMDFYLIDCETLEVIDEQINTWH